MNSQTLKTAALWSALVGFLLLLGPLFMRHKAEAANKAVGLAVEAQTVQDLASLSGVTFKEAAEALKLQGLIGVAFSEETVAELQAKGALTLTTDADGVTVTGSEIELNRVLDFGKGRLPGLERQITAPELRFEGSPDLLRSLSLGLNPKAVAQAKEAGLEIIARHSNGQGMGKEAIEKMLQSSKSYGSNWILPSGDQVLGRRAAQNDFIQVMKDLQLNYLTPEFAKMGGDAAVRDKIPGQTLRLHSIQQAEGDRLTDAAVIERYVKAARERGIRWLLVRPISVGGDDPLQNLEDLLLKINKGLQHEGHTVAVPRPFTAPQPFIIPIFVAYLALAPFFFWILTAGLGGLKLPGGQAIPGLIVLAAVAASLTEGTRHYAALIAAVLCPMAALLWTLDQKEVKAWRDFVIMSAFALLGGLIVAASLTGIPWMLQNDQFSGIKLAHFFPLFWGGVIVASQVVDLKKAAASPILYGSALIGLIALGVVYFMMGRTGNDSPASVSGLELQFRSLLDKILYTRPRTKEFMIGHPLLITGLFLWAASIKKPALKPFGGFAIVIGMIGLTSIVNTLCHLHSPLELNLARILIGWVIGGILGWILALAALKLTASFGERGQSK